MVIEVTDNESLRCSICDPMTNARCEGFLPLLRKTFPHNALRRIFAVAAEDLPTQRAAGAIFEKR